MRGFERRRIVDAVASHRHDFAVRLERLDDAQFLLGHDAGENRRLADPLRAAPLSSMRSSSLPAIIWPGSKPPPCAHRLGGLRIVSGDHDDANAGLAAFPNRRQDTVDAADRQGRPAREYEREYRAAIAGRQCCRAATPGDAEHPHAAAAIRRRRLHSGALGRAEAAQLGDCLRGAPFAATISSPRFLPKPE